MFNINVNYSKFICENFNVITNINQNLSIIESVSMLYDIVADTELKQKLIDASIKLLNISNNKYITQYPYKFNVVNNKVLNERNTQHYLWYSKMLYNHYLLTNDSKYYELCNNIISFTCKKNCYNNTNILINWYGNNKTNLVSLKSLTCCDMLILFNKNYYFEKTFDYLYKYAFNKNTNLFNSVVDVTTNKSQIHKKNYLHENLELAEGLFNCYEIDNNKYKKYYIIACNIVKECVKHIPNNVNNLAPLQCYYWGIKYNLLNNNTIKTLEKRINIIINNYKQNNYMSHYTDAKNDNIFPYIYLQRIITTLLSYKNFLRSKKM